MSQRACLIYYEPSHYVKEQDNSIVGYTGLATQYTLCIQYNVISEIAIEHLVW